MKVKMFSHFWHLVLTLCQMGFTIYVFKIIPIECNFGKCLYESALQIFTNKDQSQNLKIFFLQIFYTFHNY